MTRTRTKVLAVFIVAILDAVVRHHLVVRTFHHGREAFLVQQAHYFDTTRTRHSWITSFILAGFGMAIVIGAYELLVWIFTKPNESLS